MHTVGKTLNIICLAVKERCWGRVCVDEVLVGAWGFEPQTPTVSIHEPAPRVTRNAFMQRNF